MTTTLKDCRQQIPIEKITQIFKAALYVTAGLGFSYMWIDSLCILQDIPRQWEQDSAVMHCVYRNVT